MKYDQLLKHEKECDFVEIPCPNCEELLKRCELENHRNTCDLKAEISKLPITYCNELTVASKERHSYSKRRSTDMLSPLCYYNDSEDIIDIYGAKIAISHG